MGNGWLPTQKEETMKKIISILILFALAICTVCGCAKKSELSSDNPVTLTMWHVYGEQSNSPMNLLIDEFNRTEGKQKGVIINVTSMTNASQIGPQLLEAQADNPGSPNMPDLFFCHSNNAQALGEENLVNWNDYFTKEELSEFIPEFVEDGMVGEKLAIFPVSKSTHMLFVAGGVFERFSADTGVTYEDLSTWDGFFDVCEKYYEWSGGKPFCAIDYLIRCVELSALSEGSGDFYNGDGWYDYSNEIFKESYMKFASAIAKGHIVVSDLYSNTQVMTGEVMAGIGSSASILYYNDTITYPDNTKEPMNLKVIPYPQTGNGENLVTQAGVGLCAYKTTTQKAEAAYVFAKWLTEKERNVDFVTDTGYMPVRKESLSDMEDYKFDDEGYRSLYEALAVTQSNCKAVTEPNFVGYYDKIYTLYDGIRQMQKNPSAYESEEDFTAAMWDLFVAVGN